MKFCYNLQYSLLPKLKEPASNTGKEKKFIILPLKWKKLQTARISSLVFSFYNTYCI